MAILTYNLSSHLKNYLNNIESLRKKILLMPISPQDEQRLVWQATVNRIFWSLALTHSQKPDSQLMTRRQIAQLVAKANLPQKLSLQEKQVLNYKEALDYLRQKWLVSPDLITPQIIKKIHSLVNKSLTTPNRREFKDQEKDLDYVLGYLQKGSEHPVIQAGIAQSQIMVLKPFKDGLGRTSRLTSYLFFSKYGWDFRSLLVFEEFFRKDLITLKQATESVTKYKSLTLWLEYFTFGVAKQLHKTLDQIEAKNFQEDLPDSFWKLNDRQQKINDFLQKPGSRITNRQVQKLFSVSQITASRDLSKLAKLGYLFVRGRGRSVYYTKV